MSTFIRFLLTSVLALVLMTGQGFAMLSTWAATCCPQTIVQQLPSCCQTGECEKHKPIKAPSIKKQMVNCQCASSPFEFQFDKRVSMLDGNMHIISMAHPNPVMSLQLADSGSPIWLRRLFYPDRSKLFLEKNSWLL